MGIIQSDWFWLGKKEMPNVFYYYQVLTAIKKNTAIMIDTSIFLLAINSLIFELLIQRKY